MKLRTLQSGRGRAFSRRNLSGACTVHCSFPRCCMDPWQERKKQTFTDAEMIKKHMLAAFEVCIYFVCHFPPLWLIVSSVHIFIVQGRHYGGPAPRPLGFWECDPLQNWIEYPWCTDLLWFFFLLSASSKSNQQRSALLWSSTNMLECLFENSNLVTVLSDSKIRERLIDGW